MIDQISPISLVDVSSDDGNHQLWLMATSESRISLVSVSTLDIDITEENLPDEASGDYSAKEAWLLIVTVHATQYMQILTWYASFMYCS